ASLDSDRALDGVHNAGELGQDTVASRINNAALMLADHGKDDGLMRFEITNGDPLVSAHQRTLAGDVGSEERPQPTGNLWISRRSPHPMGLHSPFRSQISTIVGEDQVAAHLGMVEGYPEEKPQRSDRTVDGRRCDTHCRDRWPPFT